MNSSEWRNNGKDTIQTLSAIVRKRENPGILLLDVTGTLLFINREAQEALDALKKRPLDLYHIYSHWQNSPDPAEQGHRKTGREESPRFILQSHSSEEAYCLRPFCLTRTPPQSSSLLILVEKIKTRRHTDLTFLTHLFRLTPREQEVVISLLHGCTNKEIAASLQIEVNTVKAHLKNIMEKMGVTTRTGVLSQIVDVNRKG